MKPSPQPTYTSKTAILVKSIQSGEAGTQKGERFNLRCEKIVSLVGPILWDLRVLLSSLSKGALRSSLGTYVDPF